MGLFSKLKDIFKTKEKDEVKNEEIQKYDQGLEKTRNEFVSKLNLLGIKYTKVNEEYFEELENLLIMADIGVKTVMDFIDRLRKRVKSENITDTKYLNEVIVDELFIIYVNNEAITDKINMAASGPTVILMVGVNGVGKTTTIAKLAHKYKSEGKSIMMIAGDTFRAGAVEQLKIWAERTNSEFYGRENTDADTGIDRMLGNIIADAFHKNCIQLTHLQIQITHAGYIIHHNPKFISHTARHSIIFL